MSRKAPRYDIHPENPSFGPWMLLFPFVLQKMCETSSVRPQCITTSPSNGTASSSVCTSGKTIRNTSATSSSPSSCRYAVFLYSCCLRRCGVSRVALHRLVFWLSGVVFYCSGAAAGACTAGICSEGQREEWRHFCHGLQWHHVHYQAPHAHTFCGRKPCLCKSLLSPGTSSRNVSDWLKRSAQAGWGWYIAVLEFHLGFRYTYKPTWWKIIIKGRAQQNLLFTCYIVTGAGVIF